MTEVKEFERRRRFKNYLAKEDALGQLPIRPKVQPIPQNSQESEHCGPEQTHRIVTPKSSKTAEPSESIKPLSRPPRRPPRIAGSVGSLIPNETSSSQSQASTSSAGLYLAEDVSLPIVLPPPFSLERRVVSDAQSLPSVRLRRMPDWRDANGDG
ncbi:hypothetical protein O1611_g6699 [Lasiodiplodia mahajangana]|uniref:Uncharacterized protein n=1 Tax=Lasiodiplodia mahajangana TaxID=1108764 RepID=A0ACC2JHI2_9PEZI|nr:hypothetical protein O1611_g6699 [Lasiodiplodia mahajangana]